MTNVPHADLDRPLGTAIEEKLYTEKGHPLSFTRGEEIGGFKLGSTLVLVFEAPHFEFNIQPGQKIKLGEPIGQTKK